MALEDLKELVDQGQTVSIRGLDVKVKEFVLVDIPKVSEKVGAIKISPKDQTHEIIIKNLDVFYDVVSLSTGELVENIKKLTIPEFTELASKVVEVNMDLFLESVIPKINFLNEKIEKAFPEINKKNQTEAQKLNGPK